MMGFNGAILPDEKRQQYIDAIKSGIPVSVPGAFGGVHTYSMGTLKTYLIQDAYQRAGATCTWGTFPIDALPWAA